MEDKRIIELYWQRSEQAITATAAKYGRYCHAIAYNILHSAEDSEECVNDTYLKTWESIPPKRPDRFSVFLGRITRNLSLNRYKHYTAEKRGGGQTALILEELQECVPAAESVEAHMDEQVTVDVLNAFLSTLSGETRRMFLRRYWYMESIQEIAARYHLGESKVKMTLLRARARLREQLEKEGVFV